MESLLLFASGQESTQALNGYEVAILTILFFHRM